MWPVSPPSISVDEIARKCAARMRDKPLAARVRAAIPQLLENSDLLSDVIEDGRTYAVQPRDFDVNNLTDDELTKLYDRQVAHPRGAARKYYDELLASARFRLCSYCQYGQATTLDHFLPKSWISGLAIEPWNLVPACQQCNKTLSSQHASSEETMMFHPYVEHIEERWLHAELLEGTDPAVVFEARPPETMDSRLRARVLSQFRTLKLDLMYTAVSARDIFEAKSSLLRGGWTEKNDASGVARYLLEIAEDALVAETNSRRGAVYEALASSDWFCSEGFRG